MTTATVEQIRQERQENIADRVDVWLQKLGTKHQVAGRGAASYRDQALYERGLEETKDLVIAAARTAGLEKEASKMERCGKDYAVSRCTDCGEYIGHAYHCDERLCPTCFYRNLFRFMKRHEQSWDATKDITLISVDYGHWRSWELEEGLAYAKDLHKALVALFVLLWGGIYHIQLKWDEEYHEYHIIYHYLINDHVNYAFYFNLALQGVAVCEDYKSFGSYAAAQSYFIRHCCQYPADILLDYTKVAFYLGLMKHRKLIQGFGALYRVTGGLNRSARDKSHRTCPICSGKLSWVGLTTRDFIFWNDKHKCYTVDPGAPGL